MSEETDRSRSISRRGVIAGSAALAASASIPRLASAAPPAKYKRWNLSDPNCPPRVLDSYKKAIRAMLALPPADPRNWYRHALIHTLDCPHGNWWFLPWHRGYLGWFERICRELSGDPDFALPYWDWTQEPRIPKVMFEDVLDPGQSPFVASGDAFRSQFNDAIAKAGYWALSSDGSPSPQYEQLLIRSIRFPDDLWFDILKNPGGHMFFDKDQARTLTKDKPDLADYAQTAVALPSVLDALGPRDFVSFASGKTRAHSSAAVLGVLESQPHNLVHRSIGGFMSDLMSPTDPVFFLHHSNIDRLWDVWTRKQLAYKYPILPDGYPAQPGDKPKAGSDYAAWAAENFLFFVDAKGNPVQQDTAEAYAAIGDFDYDYSPGSGDAVVPVAPQVAAVATVVQQPLAAALSTRQVGGGTVTNAAVRLPAALVHQQADPLQAKLFASVTVDLPPHGDEDYDVYLRRLNGTLQFVATLAMFGHHHVHGPVTFQVPLSAALSTLQADQMLDANPTLDLQVVARAKAAGPHLMMGHAAPAAPAAAPGGPSPVTAISLRQL